MLHQRRPGWGGSPCRHPIAVTASTRQDDGRGWRQRLNGKAYEWSTAHGRHGEHQGHKGPPPEDYHVEVFKRLQDALRDCQTWRECRRDFMNALDELAGDICTPGSRLNKLATRKQ
ncbi:MAG TPA: AHH domain-containing protein [Archangium sp.]|nr:AHH domain-containing protein [Archangium sp.]